MLMILRRAKTGAKRISVCIIVLIPGHLEIKIFPRPPYGLCMTSLSRLYCVAPCVTEENRSFREWKIPEVDPPLPPTSTHKPRNPKGTLPSANGRIQLWEANGSTADRCKLSFFAS